MVVLDGERLLMLLLPLFIGILIANVIEMKVNKYLKLFLILCVISMFVYCAFESLKN